MPRRRCSRRRPWWGHEVIGDVHLGDWGTPIGMVITELKERKPGLVYFDENYEGEYPKETPITEAEFAEIYPLASAKSKEDPEFKARALCTAYGTGCTGTPCWDNPTSDRRCSNNSGRRTKGCKRNSRKNYAGIRKKKEHFFSNFRSKIRVFCVPFMKNGNKKEWHFLPLFLCIRYNIKLRSEERRVGKEC